ncbi:MAG: hypothetical protein GY842_00505, partial [bacterium]|nr:hypothetical protein [bacterium]
MNDVVAGADGAWLYVADGSVGVLRVDPTTGATTTFVAAGSGGLIQAFAISLGPGGDLLVADRAGHAVRRYDAASGAYVADFIPSGSSPMTSPSSLAYGPSGNLFVGNADAVYEYNGTTGVYVGLFVASGSGGLNDAYGMVFKEGGILLVSSYGSDELLEYDGDTGAFLRVFNDPSVYIEEPWGVGVGRDGRVMLACKGDGGTGRVYAYDANSGRYQFFYILGTLTAPAGFCY